MNNSPSCTPQQPGSAPPQGITQEYVAQLVVAFMQLYACILALPGGPLMQGGQLHENHHRHQRPRPPLARLQRNRQRYRC